MSASPSPAAATRPTPSLCHHCCALPSPDSRGSARYCRARPLCTASRSRPAPRLRCCCCSHPRSGEPLSRQLTPFATADHSEIVTAQPLFHPFPAQAAWWHHPPRSPSVERSPWPSLGPSTRPSPPRLHCARVLRQLTAPAWWPSGRHQGWPDSRRLLPHSGEGRRRRPPAGGAPPQVQLAGRACPRPAARTEGHASSIHVPARGVALSRRTGCSPVPPAAARLPGCCRICARPRPGFLNMSQVTSTHQRAAGPHFPRGPWSRAQSARLRQGSDPAAHPARWPPMPAVTAFPRVHPTPLCPGRGQCAAGGRSGTGSARQ